MTNVYLVRHAEAERDFETVIRPLTKKGLTDSEKVKNYLCDKNINVVISSDYRRCIETLSDFSNTIKIKIEKDIRFRERKRNSSFHLTDDDFKSLMGSLFADFDYIPESGEENLNELQDRSTFALKEILKKHNGKNIVIGTHISTMYAIMNKYDSIYGFCNFCDNFSKTPWVVKMSFDECICKVIELINL